MDFLIDSPSSRSASLAMKSSLFPDLSTPTKSLCSAGEKYTTYTINTKKKYCPVKPLQGKKIIDYINSRCKMVSFSKIYFHFTCLFLALLAWDGLCEFVGFAH